MTNFIIKPAKKGMPSSKGVEFKGNNAKKKYDENYDRIFGRKEKEEQCQQEK
jgi:hypothetical protein